LKAILSLEELSGSNGSRADDGSSWRKVSSEDVTEPGSTENLGNRKDPQVLQNLLSA
jgi:hypothetical protein